MSAWDAAKRLADYMRQSRAEARRWSDAETWQDLCELVAQFCEGDRPRTPNHGGPRDPETVAIGAELANANRQGFLTAGSQPARAGVQNAEVMGFATDEMVEKMRRLVAGTRLVMEVREPRKPFHRRDSDWHVTAGQAEEMFPGWDFSEDKQVRIFDPDDGDSRLLWDRLGQADWDNPAPPAAKPYTPPKRRAAPAAPCTEQPTAAPTTGSAGGAMASIEEVRASIMQGTQSLTDALGMLKQAESEIESGQQSIMHAVEGSGQNDAQEALGLLQRALESVAETVQMVNAAAQSAETVAAHL